MNSLPMHESFDGSKSEMATEAFIKEKNQGMCDGKFGIRQLQISGKSQKAEGGPSKEESLFATESPTSHSFDSLFDQLLSESYDRNIQYSSSSSTDCTHALEVSANGLLPNQSTKDNLGDGFRDIKVTEKYDRKIAQSIEERQIKHCPFLREEIRKANGESQKTESSIDSDMSMSSCWSITSSILDIAISLVSSTESVSMFCTNADSELLKAELCYDNVETAVTVASHINVCDLDLPTKSVSRKEKELIEISQNNIKINKHKTAKNPSETGNPKLTKIASTSTIDESLLAFEFHNSLEIDGPTKFQSIQNLIEFGNTQIQSYANMNAVNETNFYLNGDNVTQMQNPTLVEQNQSPTYQPVSTALHSSQNHCSVTTEQQSLQAHNPMFKQQSNFQTQHPASKDRTALQFQHPVSTKAHSLQFQNQQLKEHTYLQFQNLDFKEFYSSQTSNQSFINGQPLKVPLAVFTKQHPRQSQLPNVLDQHLSASHETVLREQNIPQTNNLTNFRIPSCNSISSCSQNHAETIPHLIEESYPNNFNCPNFQPIESGGTNFDLPGQSMNFGNNYCQCTVSEYPQRSIFESTCGTQTYSTICSDLRESASSPVSYSLNSGDNSCTSSYSTTRNAFGNIPTVVTCSGAYIDFGNTSSAESYLKTCSRSDKNYGLKPYSTNCNDNGNINGGRSYPTTANTSNSSSRQFPYATTCPISKGKSSHSSFNRRKNITSQSRCTKGYCFTNINSQMVSNPVNHSTNMIVQQPVTAENLNHGQVQPNSDISNCCWASSQNPSKVSKDKSPSVPTVQVSSIQDTKWNNFHYPFNVPNGTVEFRHVPEGTQGYSSALNIGSSVTQKPLGYDPSVINTGSSMPHQYASYCEGTQRVNNWFDKNQFCREVKKLDGPPGPNLTSGRDINLITQQAQVKMFQEKSIYDSPAVGMFTGMPVQNTHSPSSRKILSKKNPTFQHNSEASIPKHESKIHVSSSNTDSFNNSKILDSRKQESYISNKKHNISLSDPTVQKIRQKKLPMYHNRVNDQAEEDKKFNPFDYDTDYMNFDFCL